MSRTPLDDRLSDVDARIAGAAEADLARLLCVEPSVEFAARARARIAAEAPARAWRSRRLVLTLAAASVLLLVFSLRGGLSVRNNVRSTVSPPPQDVVLRSTPHGGAALVDRQTPTILPLRRTVRRAPPRVANVPEVIVDPSIALAIRRLARAARSTVLDDAAAPTPPRARAGTTPGPDALPVAEPLVVPKLPLTPADQAGGI
jgi:hypothetical protein